MNKIQIALLIFIVLALILGATFALSYTAKPAPLQAYPATINRDCAPWDGPAFTVNIPLNDGRFVSVSIWQAPELGGPVTFTFPDASGQVGNVSMFPAEGMLETLSGTVHFQSVQAERSVEGQFDLVDGSDVHFKGKFSAAWGDGVTLCG